MNDSAMRFRHLGRGTPSSEGEKHAELWPLRPLSHPCQSRMSCRMSMLSLGIYMGG